MPKKLQHHQTMNKQRATTIMKKLLFTVILFAFGSIQVLDAQQRWDEIEYPPLNNFEKPDVTEFQLDNGIRFYLVEDDELPLINLSVIVRTGGVLVPNEKAGLNSITGTVMRTGGSTSVSGDELNELLENRAARMETGIGFTSGSATMNVLKEDFEELLPVFIDLIKNPAFPEERIELAKTQQKSSISRRNDDQAPVANREFRRLIYGEDSVYGRNVEYETIDNITRDDLIEFHEKSFVGKNFMIGVIGDFKSQEMKETLEAAFSDYPAGEETVLEFPEIDYQFEKTVNFVDKRDVNQSYVLLGHIGGMRDNPDYASLQMMNRVLSDGFSGRLMRIVRSQMGLAYAVFGSYGSNNFFPGTFTSGVMTRSASTAEAIEAIIEQIERLQNELVSEEELRDTRDRFLNSLVFQYESRASVLNERLSYEYAGLPPDTFDQLVEEIRQVTAEDIQEAARNYLRPDALQILVVGNGAEIGDQLEQFGDVNEIDITIPEPPDDEDGVAGDTELGREWLAEMSNAILPNGNAEVITVESEQTIQTPQGAMTLGNKATLDFRNKEFINEMNAPMGQIILEISDGSGVMKMGGQEQPMPPQQYQSVMNEYERHYVNLALNGSSIQAEFIGETEINSVPVVELRVQLENPVTLFLNRESALPVASEVREMDPQQGRRITVQSHYDDWQIADGVAFAYKTVTKIDGEEQSSTVVSVHRSGE
jgi:zinc protease